MPGSTPVGPPVPGTRPAGTRDETNAARRVREMFSGIAPRYDFLNHLLSFSFDRLWRRRTAARFRHILNRADARVLDLCCGTGDLTLALLRAGRAQVWGSDFAHPMLVLAKGKSGASRVNNVAGPFYVEADALQLPLPDASFDLVTAAFGFRNLANYERGVREMCRLLRPGGEVGILEFSEPRGALLGPLYGLYFRKILPRIGGAISGNREAYSYLPNSVEKFPWPDQLNTLLEQAGFREVRFELWAGGIVALHRAQKR